MLREFLYLDDRLVVPFLDQVLGGRPGDETVRTTGERRQGVKAEGKLGPVTGGLDRGRTQASETSATTSPTRFSQFALLEQHLGDEIHPVEPMDDEAWDGFERGEVVRVEGALELPTIVRQAAQARQVAPLMDFITDIVAVADAIGQPVGLDPAEVQRVQRTAPAISGFADQLERDTVPVLVTPATGASQRFVALLHPHWLLVDNILDLSGEVVVMAKIRSLIPRSKPVHVEEFLPSLPQPPRAERRKKPSGKGTTRTTVRYPGAVLTPVAVYR